MAAGPPPTWLLLLFYGSLIVGGVVGVVELSSIWLKLLMVPVILYGLFCFVVTAPWFWSRRR